MIIFRILGAILFLIGLIIFTVGKKFVLLRAYFGDRSMFAQIFWGLIFAAIGTIFLYISGAFT